MNGNTYETCRRALCGCSAALADIGFSEQEADEKALELLGDKWPCVEAAAQVLGSSTTRNAASFWAIAFEHGYELPKANSQQAGDCSASEQATDELRQAVEDGFSGSQLQTLIGERSTRFKIQAF